MSGQLGQTGGEFDPPIERLRSKHSRKWHHAPDDVLPAWVAETDFDLCPAIVDALRSVLERGDLGYPDWAEEPLAGPFSERMSKRYGWEPDPAQVRHVCNLVQAVQIVMEITTRPGEAVAMHVPNYPPFLQTLRSMDRALAPWHMHDDGESWVFDSDRLEEAVSTSGARLLLLVNPHNPTGRVFGRSELESIAAIACRHDLVVISDELHAELILDDRAHLPFASLGAEVAERTVTVTSATKSFNLGGLGTAVAHVGDGRVRAAWDRMPEEYFGSLSAVGVEATLAAWKDGDAWLAAQCRHLTAQRDHLADRLAELRGVTFHPPEATYLAWLDARGAGLTQDPAAFFLDRARVQLNSGPLFGESGAGFVRLNFATSRRVLDEILDRMSQSLAQ